MIVYETLRDVEAGEELCVNYGMRLWFEDADGLDGERVDEKGEKKSEEETEDVLGAIEV